jgi:hypothetical protein
MINLPKKEKEKGQTLLVMVLVMAVALTIGLAVVARSVTNIQVSTEQEESARAFSAAEAGIESALAGESIPDLEGMAISVECETMGEAEEFVFPKEVAAGKTQTVWLIGHTEDGELDPDDGEARYSGETVEVYWGNEGTEEGEATTPALEASLLYKEGNDFKVKRFTADPNSGRGNQFDSLSGSAGYSLAGENLQFYRTLDLPIGVVSYLLRLKLLYADDDHLLAVKGVSDDLSAQGNCCRSTASSVNSQVTRTVRQCQFYKAPPGIFDFTLYSENDLSK